VSTLRARLAASPPPVSMRVAWRAFLVALRREGRSSGAPGLHRDRAALERALDRVLDAPSPAEEATLEGTKRDLRDLVHGGLSDRGEAALALRVDQALAALAGQVATGTVALRVQGWPPGLEAEQRAAILGVAEVELEALDARQAAALVHALDGEVLGGSTLRVELQLPPGMHLPGPDRAERDRSRRDGQRPWLPHLDEVGRHSLSSPGLARSQAALFDEDVVIDAFCGCGGNALALAQAGRRVQAVERDPGRAALARRNALALDLPLVVHLGDAASLLPALAAACPGAGLFLDPPWEDDQGGRRLDWASLVPLPLVVLTPFAHLVLKAPRAFDLSSLPASWTWTWRFELAAPGADGRRPVQAITCQGRRGATS